MLRSKIYVQAPDPRYKILEEELNEAFHNGCITKLLLDKAKKELKK